MISINIFSVKQVREREAFYDCPANIGSPADVNKAIRAVLELETESVEKFGFFSLNSKNAIIGLHIIGVGTLNATLVHPREIFKAAILNNAASIILFHNHPSGDPTPSPDDIALTNNLVTAGKILKISVQDHVIIGEREYVSLRQRNLMCVTDN